MQLALNISHVSEIIDRPISLLQPPYALDFVDGILNLRGELITLIDPRILYNLPTTKDIGGKVLIFHKEGKKYGMVVESVDEIVNVSGAQLLDVPSIARNGDARTVSEDVAGCVRVPSKGAESEPVMVLDVDSLIARCVEIEN